MDVFLKCLGEMKEITFKSFSNEEKKNVVLFWHLPYPPEDKNNRQGSATQL